MGKYEIRRHGLEVSETYFDLMRLSFDEEAVQQTAEAIQWMFAYCPARHSTGSFFLSLEREGKVIGGTIVVADTVWLGGEERPAFLPIGNHVHPDHRGRGLRLLKEMSRLAERGVSMGLPNERSFGIHRRFDASVSRPRTTRFRSYLPGALLAARRPKLSFLSPVVNAVSLASNALVNLIRPRLRKGESIEEIEKFGPDFDTFWELARVNHDFLCVRSAERMNWRYVDAPFSKYTVDVLRYDGAIKGVVVARVADRKGHLVGEISDILCVENNSRDYALLLAAAGDRFADAGVAFSEFAFIGDGALDAAGRRTGFWFPRDKRQVVAYGLGARDAKAVPHYIDNMHFLRGDHDEDY